MVLTKTKFYGMGNVLIITFDVYFYYHITGMI